MFLYLSTCYLVSLMTGPFCFLVTDFLLYKLGFIWRNLTLLLCLSKKNEFWPFYVFCFCFVLLFVLSPSLTNGRFVRPSNAALIHSFSGLNFQRFLYSQFNYFQTFCEWFKVSYVFCTWLTFQPKIWVGSEHYVRTHNLVGFIYCNAIVSKFCKVDQYWLKSIGRGALIHDILQFLIALIEKQLL